MRVVGLSRLSTIAGLFRFLSSEDQTRGARARTDSSEDVQRKNIILKLRNLTPDEVGRVPMIRICEENPGSRTIPVALRYFLETHKDQRVPLRSDGDPDLHIPEGSYAVGKWCPTGDLQHPRGYYVQLGDKRGRVGDPIYLDIDEFSRH